jgi:hypothetical protein
LKNDPKDLDLIIKEIEELACTNNPGPTAVSAVQFIDDTYILLPREALPTLSFGSLDEAFGGNSYARTKNLTENVFDRDFRKIRDLGLQYLVMADHIEAKIVKAEIDSSKARRFKVFRELFPESECTLDKFHWSSMTQFEQTVIDKMVLLNMELDKKF